MFFRLVAILAVFMLSWGLASASEKPFCDEKDNAVHVISSKLDCLDHSQPFSDDDPCHKGVCHFGHCLHIRVLQSSFRNEIHIGSSAKAETPYKTSKINGVVSLHERPPIFPT